MDNHDTEYRLLFSHPEMIRGLLLGFVPEYLGRELDLDSLRRSLTEWLRPEHCFRDGCPQRWIAATMLLHQSHCALSELWGNLFDLVMAPFSQIVEPPRYRGGSELVILPGRAGGHRPVSGVGPVYPCRCIDGFLDQNNLHTFDG